MDSLHKGPLMRNFDVSLMFARTNCRTYTQVAGDMRLHGAYVKSFYRLDIIHQRSDKYCEISPAILKKVRQAMPTPC